MTSIVSEASVQPLMSIEDVAAYLRVSPRWVYDQVRSGQLPAMRIARSWRLRREAVDDFACSFTACMSDRPSSGIRGTAIATSSPACVRE